MYARIKQTILFKPRLVLFSVLLLAYLVYHEVGTHLFQTRWDDQWAALNWYTEEGFSGDNIKDILLDFYGGQYGPLNQFYYTFLFSIFGYNASAFHIGGLVIHFLTIIAVYLFLSKFLRYSNIIEPDAVNPVVLATVLIFAIHPFNVESVAWIAASKILLYGLFYFLALYTYVLYRENGQKRYYFVTLLLFSISFLGKEQAVALPLTLILIDLVLSEYKIRKKELIEKIPFFILSVFFGFVTLLSQLSNHAGALSERQQYPLFQRIPFAAYTLCEYFIKCIIPVKLMHVYPFPNVIGEPLNTTFYFYPFMLLIVLVWFFKNYKIKWLFFGGTFFIINLLIVLHLIPISRFAIVADRYVYVASVGVFFLVAYVMYLLIKRAQKTLTRRMILTSSFLFICSLGAYAYVRNKAWHDSDSLKKEIKSIIENRKDYQQLQQKYQSQK